MSTAELMWPKSVEATGDEEFHLVLDDRNCTFKIEMKGVSPSVRKAVVALRVYATELERERVSIDEEMSYYQQILSLRQKKDDKVKPIAQRMVKPIFELNDQMNLNLSEIQEIRKKNASLRAEIASVRQRLANCGPSCEATAATTSFLYGVLSDYQNLFTDFTKPPPLPFPHSADAEINWAIINSEAVDLDEPAKELCRRMANLSGSFNDLPMAQKREVMFILRELKAQILLVIREIKGIDLDVADPMRRKVMIRMCVKKYAALSLSMHKVKFIGSAQ